MHCRLWYTSSILLVAKVPVIKFCNIPFVTWMVQMVGYTTPFVEPLSFRSTLDLSRLFMMLIRSPMT